MGQNNPSSPCSGLARDYLDLFRFPLIQDFPNPILLKEFDSLPRAINIGPNSTAHVSYAALGRLWTSHHRTGSENVRWRVPNLHVGCVQWHYRS